MILNLNQFSFQNFGTVQPVRGEPDAPPATPQTVRLEGKPAYPVFRTVCPTRLSSRSGMVVLSVSQDGEAYTHYYLDKPVCLQESVCFTLAPLLGESSAELAARELPERTGRMRPAQPLHLYRSVSTDSLYTFFYQEREKGFIFSGEAHPMLELTYVDKGTLHSVADGVDLLLEKGEMAIYGPNQWHMQYADIDVAASFITVTFDLANADVTPLLDRKLPASQTAVTLLRMMLQEQEAAAACAGDMILCLLNQLVIELLRTEGAPRKPLRTTTNLHNENAVVRRAQQYISAHIREKLTVPMVAQNVEVSSSYLTALFRRNLQISPGEYIRRVKLQESKQMIRENNMNFTQIAAALNYSTVHHFSRQFKENFGITPSEYARSVR